MTYHDLVVICVYLALVAVTVAIDQEECDKTTCLGPLAYYKALGCSPVYEKEGDCCATKYNCDHLKERSATKCYVNGKEYEVGEKLKDEDTNRCEFSCTCVIQYDGFATFLCAFPDCVYEPSKPGCYRKNSPSKCCPGEEVCVENPEDLAVCNVSGRVYKEGEYFYDDYEPDLTCVCQPGYEGKNVEPFCVKPKRCSEYYNEYHDFNKCAPVYYIKQSPQTSCSVFSRCQSDNDTVIHDEDHPKSVANPDDGVCYFGNLTIPRGDELSQGTDFITACIKCVCEVPPVPTCSRLPYEECDI